MIKKITIIFALFFLANCAAKYETQMDVFSKNKTKRTIAFKLDVTYNKERFENCSFFFSKNKKERKNISTAEDFLKYQRKDNYVFVTTDSKEIYLTGIGCVTNKIIYRAKRFRTINQQVFVLQNSDNSAIHYAGDIKINWIAQPVKTADFFNVKNIGLSRMEASDNGSFSIELKDDYKSYSSFMKKNFGKLKSVNDSDEIFMTKFALIFELENNLQD